MLVLSKYYILKLEIWKAINLTMNNKILESPTGPSKKTYGYSPEDNSKKFTRKIQNISLDQKATPKAH